MQVIKMYIEVWMFFSLTVAIGTDSQAHFVSFGVTVE